MTEEQYQQLSREQEASRQQHEHAWRLHSNIESIKTIIMTLEATGYPGYELKLETADFRDTTLARQIYESPRLSITTQPKTCLGPFLLPGLKQYLAAAEKEFSAL